jgi:hypothetical protein
VQPFGHTPGVPKRKARLAARRRRRFRAMAVRPEPGEELEQVCDRHIAAAVQVVPAPAHPGGFSSSAANLANVLRRQGIVDQSKTLH